MFMPPGQRHTSTEENEALCSSGYCHYITPLSWSIKRPKTNTPPAHWLKEYRKTEVNLRNAEKFSDKVIKYQC